MLLINNYIVRSYRDVIVITKFATRRAIKAQNTVMYYNKKHTKNINKNNRLTMGEFSKVL